MLDEVSASNLGLIARSTIQLDPGFTVITGETGTGKTLMLGALRLLRGDKAGKGYIGPVDDRCEVAGRFVDGENEVVARRSVDGNRSRAYLDDTPTSIAGLAEAMADRIAIVGQHDQLTITSSAGVRSILDGMMTSDDRRTVADYAAAWSTYRSLRSELEELSGDTRSLERELDLLRYQVDEIDALGLDVDEADQLQAHLVRLRNAEGLGTEYASALSLLGDDGAAGSIAAASEHLAAAADLDETLSPLVDRLSDVLTELSEATGDIAMQASAIESDPEALDEAEQRQAAINTMRRKYGETVKDVLAYRDEAAAKADELAQTLAAASTIEQRCADAEAEVREVGSQLTHIRAHIGQSIAERATDHLLDLGFRDPVVAIEVEPAEPASHGCDRAVLLFASDAELTPGPASAIASGGELSRLIVAAITQPGINFGLG